MAIKSLMELAAYAEEHGLDQAHVALSRALVELREKESDDDFTFATDADHWFSNALEFLIAYARRKGWNEALDHLLEAKMAFDEREDSRPDGNIIAFRHRKPDEQ